MKGGMGELDECANLHANTGSVQRGHEVGENCHHDSADEHMATEFVHCSLRKVDDEGTWVGAGSPAAGHRLRDMAWYDGGRRKLFMQSSSVIPSLYGGCDPQGVQISPAVFRPALRV
jgi:hypothetical protein